MPAWHEAHRELPFVFAGSGAAAAGGLAMVALDASASGPARRMAVAGSVLELSAVQTMEHRLGMVAEPYQQGGSGRLMRIARALTVSGLALSAGGPTFPAARAVAGASYVAGSVVTRFGIFEAGLESARDPKYTVVPQTERLARRQAEAGNRVAEESRASVASPGGDRAQ